jgi:hypothetical protein
MLHTRLPGVIENLHNGMFLFVPAVGTFLQEINLGATAAEVLNHRRNPIHDLG